jgi:predicted membrane protein
MDLFVASGLTVGAVVLFAAFGLAQPERRRPLLIGSAVVVGVILVAQALIGLFGAQDARLTLLAAATLALVFVAAHIYRQRQHG